MKVPGCDQQLNSALGTQQLSRLGSGSEKQELKTQNHRFLQLFAEVTSLLPMPVASELPLQLHQGIFKPSPNFQASHPEARVERHGKLNRALAMKRGCFLQAGN